MQSVDQDLIVPSLAEYELLDIWESLRGAHRTELGQLVLALADAGEATGTTLPELMLRYRQLDYRDQARITLFGRGLLTIQATGR
ncbi:MAG TPA: hypothetical protein VI279_01385 [Rhodocyclaceae bacterium]